MKALGWLVVVALDALAVAARVWVIWLMWGWHLAWLVPQPASVWTVFGLSMIWPAWRGLGRKQWQEAEAVKPESREEKAMRLLATNVVWLIVLSVSWVAHLAAPEPAPAAPISQSVEAP